MSDDASREIAPAPSVAVVPAAPQPVTAKQRGIEQLLGLAALLFLLIGAFLVMLPFVSASAWAVVLAFALWPVFRRVLHRVGGRRTIAALIMTSAIALVLVVPTVVIVMNLTDDAQDLARATRRWVADGPPAAPKWLYKLPLIGSRAAAYWDDLAQDAAPLLARLELTPNDESTAVANQPVPSTTQPMSQNKLVIAASGVLSWARQWIPVASLAIVQGLTQILLSVFLTFFIFRDGEALAARLGVAVRRISGERGLHLLGVAGSTTRGVVYGILGTALVQGALAAIGFLIAGVPGAALLGLVTFFLSPLPVGPPLVWIPAVLWLFHEGRSGWGIFMLVWGLGVSSVDNVVKPWIISHGSATPFILILFGVIGGALTFGFIGVFLGPTLLAVVYRLIEQWSRETSATSSVTRM